MAQRVGVEAIVDLTDFNRGVGIYLTGIDRMWLGSNKAVAAIAADFNLLGKLAAAVGASLTLAVAGGAATLARSYLGFTSSAVDSSAELEQSIANIAATLGMAIDEADALKQTVLDLGIDPNLKVSIFEAADSMLMLAKNGLTAQQIMDGAAKASIALANATGGDFVLAADVVTDALAMFKIEASDVERVLDGVAGVVNRSKFDLNDYFLALANSGAIFQAVGGNFEELNTALTLVSNAFNTGRRAGTGFSQFIVRMPGLTKQARDKMMELGIITHDAMGGIPAVSEELAQQLANLEGSYFSVLQQIRDYQSGTIGAMLSEQQRADAIAMLESQASSLESELDPLYKQLEELSKQTSTVGNRFFDAEGNFLGMENAAQVLKETLGDLSDLERSIAIKEIFGVDAQEVVVRLMEEGAEGWQKFAETLADVSGFEIAATRMQTLQGSLQKLRDQVEVITIQIGDKFNRGTKRFVDTLVSLVGASNLDIASAWDPAAQAFDRMVDRIIPLVEKYFPDFIVLIERINRVIAVAFDWLADLAIDAIPWLIDAVMRVTDWIEQLILTGNLFNNAFGALPVFLQRVVRSFVDFVNIGRQVIAWFRAFFDGLKAIFQPFREWFDRSVTMVDVFLALGAAIAFAFAPLAVLAGRMVLLAAVAASVIAVVREKFMVELHQVLNFAKDLIYDFARTFVNVVQFIGRGDFESAWEEVIGFGSRTWDKLWKIIKWVIDRIIDLIKRIDWGAIWRGLLNAVVKLGRDVINFLANEIDWDWVWQKVSEAAIAAFDWTVDYLRNNIDWAGMWQWIIAHARIALEWVVEYIRSVDWEGLWQWAWEHIKTYAMLAWEWVIDYIQNIDWAGIWETIKFYARAAWDWVVDYVTEVWPGIWATIKDHAREGWDWIVNYAKATWPGVWDWIKRTAVSAWNWLVDQVQRLWPVVWQRVQEFGIAVWQAIVDFVNNINWNRLWQDFQRIVNQGLEDIIQFLLNLDWDRVFQRFAEIGGSVRTFVIGLINRILTFLADDVNWRDTTFRILNAILNGLDQASEELDWGALGRFIYNFLTGVALGVYDVLAQINWGEVWDNLLDSLETTWNTIKGEVGGWDWESIWATTIRVGSFALDVATTILEFLTGVLNDILNWMAFDVDWKEVFKSILSGASGGLIAIISQIDWVAAATAIKEIIIGFIGAVSEIVQEIDWEAVWLEVQAISKALWEGIVEILAAVPWEPVWEVIKAGATLLWDFVKEKAQLAWDWIVDYIDGIDWEEVWEIIKGHATTSWEFVYGEAKKAWDWIVDYISEINWEEVWETVRGPFEEAWQGVLDYFFGEEGPGTRLINWLEETFPNSVATAKEAWENITEKFKELQETWSEALDELGDDWDTWKDRIDTVLELVVEAVEIASGLVIEALNEIILFLQGESEQAWIIWAGLALVFIGLVKAGLLAMAAAALTNWLIVSGLVILAIGLMGKEILEVLDGPLTDLNNWFDETFPRSAGKVVGLIQSLSDLFAVFGETIGEITINIEGDMELIDFVLSLLIEKISGTIQILTGLYEIIFALGKLVTSKDPWNELGSTGESIVEGLKSLASGVLDFTHTRGLLEEWGVSFEGLRRDTEGSTGKMQVALDELVEQIYKDLGVDGVPSVIDNHVVPAWRDRLPEGIKAGNVKTGEALYENSELFRQWVDAAQSHTVEFPEKFAVLGEDALLGFSEKFKAGEPATMADITAFAFEVTSLASGIREGFFDAGEDSIAGFAQAISEKHGFAVDAVEEFLREVIGASNDTLGIDSPSKVYREMAENVVGSFDSGIGDNVFKVLATVIKFLDDMFHNFDTNLGALVTKTVEWFDRLYRNSTEMLAELGRQARILVEEMRVRVVETINDLHNQGTAKVNQFADTVETRVRQLGDVVKSVFDEVLAYIIQKLQEIVTNAATTFNVDTFVTLGSNIVNGFISGIQSKIGEAQAKIAELVGLSAQAGEEAAQANSPARLTMPLGRDLARGIIVAFAGEMGTFQRMVEASVREVGRITAPSSIQGVQPVSGPPIASRMTSNTFGPITVNNQMDVAELEFRIRKIVRQEMGR